MIESFECSEFGLPHRQSDFPRLIDECAYIRCRNPIYKNEVNWELYGEWFCCASCLAKHVNAKKRVVE